MDWGFAMSEIEIIDAFVDGERVDAAALKQALAEPSARDHFVDAWLLREYVHDNIAGDLSVPPAERAPRRQPFAVLMTAAAVCLAAGYGVGFWSARASQSTPVSSSAAATPTAAPAAPAAVTTPVDDRAFPVPAPTRVIRLEMTSYIETAGGG